MAGHHTRQTLQHRDRLWIAHPFVWQIAPVKTKGLSPRAHRNAEFVFLSAFLLVSGNQNMGASHSDQMGLLGW